MPALAAFAKENVNFTQHMSSGNTADSGMFGLFYGISPAIWTACSRRVFPPR
jgi:membrane-anchored protein YejM (alkaline phosphatase superfamily)